MISRRLLAGVLVPLALTACASSQSRHTATLDSGADRVSLSISGDHGGWLDDLLGGRLDCSGPADGALGVLLAALDRGGPRARASVRDGDAMLTGRRRGGRVDLTAGLGDGRLEVRMPWAAAECLLGRSTALGAALDGLEVTAVGADGHRTRLRLD